MTNREFYQSVINYASGVEMSCEEVDVLTTKAQELLVALDNRNEHRKSAETKEKREASARRGLVLGFLQEHADEVFTRDQIAEAVGISVGQVTAACKGLGDAVTKSEAKIDKARKVVYQYNG